MPVSSPKTLDGVIDQISLLGQQVALPSIQNYKGEPLFITALLLDPGTARLEVKIGDQGPPASTTTLAAVPTSAFATVTYKAQTETSAVTQNAITYDGKPLIIRAGLPAPGPDKWSGSTVVPTVEEWVQPAATTAQDRLDFVIFHVEGTDGMLWWLANPPLTTAPTTSVIVPKETGPGVNGPFGIQTP